ncbi:MAG: SUMF1/EgtB/PvdO family nonheme iron enzyme [Nitrospinae bacterium]|nr:SUMF1/EgtB/PvdO family nonheme iron enzyme [Nitrospinota bacterium]
MRQIFIFLSVVSFACVMVRGAVAEERGSEMILIPAGEFIMGSWDDFGRKDEHPAHPVYLDAYYIDRYEATGKDFEAYMDDQPRVHPTITGWYERKVRPDMARRPVFGLTWKRCQNYCVWAGKRLPTEAEWERAARGTDDRIYPWGNEPPDPSRSNFGRCCFVMKGLVFNDVGNLKAGKTPNNIFDLAGNVAEWVFDWYDKNYYKVSPRKNPKGPEKGRYHTIRGGAWNSFPGYLRSSARYGYNDAKDFYGIGCRCVKSAEE